MKKFICLAFILFGATGIFAQQEKPIEKSEFDTVSSNSYRKFARQSYRQTEVFQDISTSTTPNFTNQNKLSSKTIMEYSFAARGSRSISEFDSSTLKKRTETIMIGDKIYTRIDNGEWMEKKREVRPKTESTLKTVEEQIEYKSLGTEKLDDQNASVYAKVQKQKLIDESTKSEMFVTITTKYWFGEDGGRLKEEMQAERRIKLEKSPIETVSRSSRVTVWELDPSIKIEAPIAEK
ncbi:MAG TPA: hypothetical protein VNB22_07590 [Pyrinomonadaceae bacterium]|nr:hypothetical protein [Pyrinomonadaceae bacterium]